MLCPACKTENPERSKFCSECGARLAQTATAGGAPAVAAQRAAPHVAAAEPAKQAAFGERRTVTVLFSDLKGFTTFSEKLDPEHATELINTLFEKFTSIITHHGGFRDKVIGDAIMAVFGVPEAHEDDAIRAVSCALEMVQVFQVWQEEWKVETGLRTGINTGEVVWGDVAGSGATVMGDTVNVAQRLESIATPGEILVSRTTQRLIEGAFILDELEPVQVKGRTEAVLPFRVARRRETDYEFLAGSGFQTRMHGRAKEIELLERALAEVVAGLDSAPESAGFPKTVLMTGEAGIGKSRLLFEFKNKLLSSSALARPGREVRVLRGKNVPYGGSPLQAVREMVCSLFGIKESTPPADAKRRLVAGMLELWRGLVQYSLVEKENFAHLVGMVIGMDFPEARVAALTPSQRMEGGFVGLRLLFTELARMLSLLLVIEDTQWADGTLLDFLDFFVRQESHCPIMLVVIARSEFLDRPDARETWATSPPPDFLRIHLAPLASEAVISLTEEALKQSPSSEFSSFVFEKTGGNPYYVLQLLRYLLEERLFRTAEKCGGIELVAAEGSATVPASLDGLLTARIDRLLEETRDTTRKASVIGKTFWQGVLEELKHKRVADDLHELQKLEIVVPRLTSSMPGDAEFAFTHSLLRDAVYKGLMLKERRILHAAVAVTIEQRALAGLESAAPLAPERLSGALTGARPTEIPIEATALCAYHYEMAGNPRKAMHLLELAADAGSGNRGWKESVRYYTRALDAANALLTGRDETLVIQRTDTKAASDNENLRQAIPRLLEKRGDAAYYGSSFRNAHDDYAEAARVIEESATSKIVPRAQARSSAGGSEQPKPPHDSVLLSRARLARKVGSTLQIIASAEEAEKSYMRALELLPPCPLHAPSQSEPQARRRTGVPPVATTEPRASASSRPGTESEPRAACPLDALGASSEPAEGSASGRTGLGDALSAGPKSPLSPLCERGETQSPPVWGDSGGFSCASQDQKRSTIRVSEGKEGQPQESLPEPCPVCLEHCTILSALGLLKGDVEGDIEAGMRLSEEAYVLATAIGAFDVAARLDMNVGTFLRMRGQLADAEEKFLRALKYAESARNLRHLSAASCNLGILYRRKGELDKALQFYARDLAISEEMGDRRGIGATACNIGVVYRYKGEFDKALESYRKDLAIGEEVGDLRGQSASHINIGVILDEKGEFDRAIESYKRALDLTQRVGDKPGDARATLNIAISLARKGDPDAAQEQFEKAAGLFDEIEHHHGLLQSYAGRGETFLCLGRNDEAIEILQKRHRLAVELKDKDEIVNALCDLGSALIWKLEFEEADRHLRAALAIADDSGELKSRANARARVADGILTKLEARDTGHGDARTPGHGDTGTRGGGKVEQAFRLPEEQSREPIRASRERAVDENPPSPPFAKGGDIPSREPVGGQASRLSEPQSREPIRASRERAVQEATRLVKEALELLGSDARFDLDTADLRLLQARALLLTPGSSKADADRAATLAAGALEVAKRRHSPNLEMAALLVLSEACAAGGKRDEALVHARQALDMAHTRKDVRMEAAASRTLAAPAAYYMAFHDCGKEEPRILADLRGLNLQIGKNP